MKNCLSVIGTLIAVDEGKGKMRANFAIYFRKCNMRVVRFLTECHIHCIVVPYIYFDLGPPTSYSRLLLINTNYEKIQYQR